MSEENARLIEEAMEDPMSPDEAWAFLDEFNKEVEWDMHNILPDLFDQEGRSSHRLSADD